MRYFETFRLCSNLTPHQHSRFNRIHLSESLRNIKVGMSRSSVQHSSCCTSQLPALPLHYIADAGRPKIDTFHNLVTYFG